MGRVGSVGDELCALGELEFAERLLARLLLALVRPVAERTAAHAQREPVLVVHRWRRLVGRGALPQVAGQVATRRTRLQPLLQLSLR